MPGRDGLMYAGRGAADMTHLVFALMNVTNPIGIRSLSPIILIAQLSITPPLHAYIHPISKLTASGVTKRSPIQVLTSTDVA